MKRSLVVYGEITSCHSQKQRKKKTQSVNWVLWKLCDSNCGCLQWPNASHNKEPYNWAQWSNVYYSPTLPPYDPHWTSAHQPRHRRRRKG